MALAVYLGLAVYSLLFWNVYRTVRKNAFEFLARKRSWLAVVRVSSVYLQCLNGYPKVREKVFVFLGRVRVSRQYFPVLDCISYSCAIKRWWLSLWLGLAVDMLQCWNGYPTVARRTSCFSLGLGLAVSIFQFWIVYHTVAQERDRGSRRG